MHNLIEDCQDVSIYLGDVCNFNCTYCDRDYIKDTIGGQKMSADDIPAIIDFFRALAFNGVLPVDMISFHGGEPYVYVKLMDQVLDAIVAEFDTDFMIFIQTNGSMILGNEWFLDKWQKQLMISISYDFMYQDINRTLFDIHGTLNALSDRQIPVQLQYVMPTNDPKVFSLRAVKSITDVCHGHEDVSVNLIPLRHIRGKDKFRVILDELDVKQAIAALLQFIQILYVMKVNVVVDGHGEGIDKHYFDNHKQLVLSPDGHIYPEYDFLEYKMKTTRIGKWKNGVEINRQQSEDHLLLEGCQTCPSREMCGLKYLYKAFDKEPEGACVEFYKMLKIVILHAQKLKQQNTLLHWIGT
jgi:radical SAM protein with 4Fe4S-binding SPASM domain